MLQICPADISHGLNKPSIQLAGKRSCAGWNEMRGGSEFHERHFLFATVEMEFERRKEGAKIMTHTHTCE